MLLKNQDLQNLQQAVAGTSLNQLTKFLEGVRQYHTSHFQRQAQEAEVIWQQGSSRLFSYSFQKDLTEHPETTFLFVPSLINRAYIFDLMPGQSMMKYLSAQGHQCLLLDWGEPTEEERHFAIDNYINRLEQLLDDINTPVILVGYCMGGLMAMATAQRKPESIAGLTLVATPWDFHSADIKRIAFDGETAEQLEDWLNTIDTVPGQLVHQWLYLLTPWSVHEKYAHFADMDPHSDEGKAFIAREHWLHDNVPLSAEVAKTCFINWAVNNTPAKGQWSVNGEVIDPSTIEIPTLIAIAKRDRIVPALCAAPLLSLMPNATPLSPITGHIGMVAGQHAEQQLWKPLENWAKGL